VLVLGNNEYALRALPLVCGVASLPLFWALARRLLPTPAAAVAVVLFALTPSLVFYASEAKQYSVDVVCTLVLLLLAARVIDARDETRPAVVLGVVGALVVWLSHAALLVLAGIGVALSAHALLTRDARRARRVVVALGPAAVSTGIAYAVSLRHLAGNRFLLEFWAAGLAPRPITPSSAARWAAHALPALFADPGGLARPVVAGWMFVGGVAVLAWCRRWPTALVVLPGVAAVAAAVARDYPIESRLSLFLVPLLVAGVSAIASLPTLVPRVRWPAAIIAGGLLVLTASHALDTTWGWVRHPIRISETRQVFTALRARAQPGDEVDVHWGAGAAYLYYGPITGVVARSQVTAEPDGGTCDDPRALAPHGTGHRVWIVFGYVPGRLPRDEVDLVLSHYDVIAHRAAHIRGDHASAWLYDFAAAPDDPTGARVRIAPGERCLVPTPQGRVPRTGLRTGPFGRGRLS
jgi:hypothetical protein